MTYNMSMLDRTLRILIALVILSLALVLDGGARWLSLLGFIPLGTALIGYCPAYSLLGMSTAPER